MLISEIQTNILFMKQSELFGVLLGFFFAIMALYYPVVLTILSDPSKSELYLISFGVSTVIGLILTSIIGYFYLKGNNEK